MLGPDGLTDAARRSLELAEARLLAQFAGRAEAAEIRNTLLRSYQELLDSATVLDFVPVLAERIAARDLASATHRTSAPTSPTASASPTASTRRGVVGVQEFGLTRDSELREDPAELVPHGLRRDAVAGRDLPDAHSVEQRPDDGQLS